MATIERTPDDVRRFHADMARLATLSTAAPDLLLFVARTLARLENMTTEAFSRGADKVIRDDARALLDLFGNPLTDD